MKILVTKDARIAGSDWKKGTILEAPTKAATAAIADGAAEEGEALEKAIEVRNAARAKKAKKPEGGNAKKPEGDPSQSTDDKK